MKGRNGGHGPGGAWHTLRGGVGAVLGRWEPIVFFSGIGVGITVLQEEKLRASE